jgi:DNA-binding XRE family transcriptional regulator
MNRCAHCGGQVVAGPQGVERPIGDRQFVGTIDGWSCPSCGERYYASEGLGVFEETIASWLADHGVTSHEELKFMRKAAGIKAADLAAWLGVTPETVSHWETGKHPTNIVTRATIASIVLETLRGESATRERLEAQGKPDAAKTVRLARIA